MEITVDGRKTSVLRAKTVGGLLLSLRLNGEEVLVKVNEKLAANSAQISQKDEVKIMRVIFGG